MLENIMDKVDVVLIGGGMAATFLKAKSYEVGLSLIETGRLDTAAGLVEETTKKGVRLLLPIDVVVAEESGAEDKIDILPVAKISKNKKIVDIGPQTIANFSEELRKCKTVLWNGPMGIFEVPRFAKGTQEIAELLASLEATTILGGGSTAEIAVEMGLSDKMTFVSTGGGASLEFLSSGTLPGVAALMDRKS